MRAPNRPKDKTGTHATRAYQHAVSITADEGLFLQTYGSGSVSWGIARLVAAARKRLGPDKDALLAERNALDAQDATRGMETAEAKLRREAREIDARIAAAKKPPTGSEFD